jgi:type I restriction enzyme, S subunit
MPDVRDQDQGGDFMSVPIKRTPTKGGHSCPPQGAKGGLENPTAISCEVWRESPLESIAQTTSGGTPDRKRAEYYSGGIPWVKSGELNDSYIFATEESLSQEGLKHSSAKLLPAGTLLMAMYGATVGKTAILKMEAATNQAVCAIFPNAEKADADFLRYFLIGERQELLKQRYGGAQPNISQNVIRNLPVRYPPLPEQRKIAGVLGVVQRAMEQQERLLALTAELKKALLHQLFTAGLRGERQKQAEIGPVPESWALATLGSLAKVGNGSTPKRDNEGYWQGGTIPWLNSAKIHERFITEADQFVTDLAVKECHLPRVKPGTVLIAITGQGKTLGNSALVSFETCINQHLAYAHFISPKIVPEFVLWFMQTRYEHLRSISQAGGSTKGALTCGYLKTYSVPVPSLNEQREIAGVFAALDRKEKVHERKHATLTALFRTLLHQLMTVQIRVHDLDLSELETATME